MRLGLLAATLATALTVLTVPGTLDAADLRSVKVTEHGALPKVKPSWPVPNDRNQIFYLQRSTNRNTVVYAANFDSAGNLKSNAPVSVYWRRYSEQGQAKPLKGVERRFAYGVNTRKRSKPGEFSLTVKPAPQLPMLVRQTGPGKAELWANIGGRSVRAIYGFLEVDESGLIPEVTGLTLYGIDPRTGRAVSERYSITGGALR